MELKTNHRTFGRKERKSGNGVLNVFGKGQKTRHPAQPIAKLNVPDARRVLPKDFPCPYCITKGRGFAYQSSFFIKKSNLRKERGKNFSKKFGTKPLNLVFSLYFLHFLSFVQGF